MDIQPLDVIIGIVLAAGLIRGLITGAVRQALGFTATIVAIILGLEFMHPVGRAAGGILGFGETIYPAVGFAIIFLGIEIAFFVLIKALEAFIRALKLSVLNRAIGGLFGVAKVVVILSVLFLVLGLFDVPEQKNRSSSALYAPVASVFPATWELASDYFPYVRGLPEKFGREIGGILSS